MKIYGKEFIDYSVEVMKQKKLNNEEVGEVLGINKRTVAEILAGRRRVLFDEGLNMCKLLGIDPRSIKP